MSAGPFTARGLDIYVARSERGYINIHIYTEDLRPENEWPESRVPKLCISVNDEDEGIRINSNGKWTGENIASPLEQLAEQA